MDVEELGTGAAEDVAPETMIVELTSHNFSFGSCVMLILLNAFS